MMDTENMAKEADTWERDRPREDREIIDGVVKEFLALCAVPHGSWREGTLADLLAGRFRDRGWSVSRDDAGNLRADIPASPGREEAPLVALQGHLDMVCAAAPGSGWDPLTDPVAARVEDGVLRTDGRSSLGADNNLGNAAVFYLLGSGRGPWTGAAAAHRGGGGGPSGGPPGRPGLAGRGAVPHQYRRLPAGAGSGVLRRRAAGDLSETAPHRSPE